jgi:pimeloyl-ACP methyl ester carboxylesterase
LQRTALCARKIGAILKFEIGPTVFPIYRCAAAEAQAVGQLPWVVRPNPRSFGTSFAKEQMMETVRSLDNTPIAFYRSGGGAPLILVPGTGAANPRAWTAVIASLEAHVQVLALDRRGHGASGDTLPYAIEREYQDIAAVIESCDQPAHLLGHSFGALLALEAALLTQRLRTLMLYEPALDATPIPPGFLERLEAVLAAGEREAAVTLYYRELVGILPHEIEQLRASAAWSERVATAHTLLRETRAEARYQLDMHRLQQLTVPTLLLTGSESPALLKAGTHRLLTILPKAQLAVLSGQQHLAMYTAPELFAQAILTFIGESR